MTNTIISNSSKGSLSGLDHNASGLSVYLQDISKSLSMTLLKSQKFVKAHSRTTSDSLSPFASTTTRKALSATMSVSSNLSDLLASKKTSHISGGLNFMRAQSKSVSPIDDISPSSVLLTGIMQSDGQVSAALSKLFSRGQRHL